MSELLKYKRIQNNVKDEDYGVIPQVKFECCEDLSKYRDANRCYNDDEIARVEVTDSAGNTAIAVLGVVGEVMIEIDGVMYTNPNDFPDKLIKAMNDGTYYDDPDIVIESDQNFGFFVNILNANNEEIMVTEAYEWQYDLSNVTKEEIYGYLYNEAVECIDRELGFKKAPNNKVKPTGIDGR